MDHGHMHCGAVPRSPVSEFELLYSGCMHKDSLVIPISVIMSAQYGMPHTIFEAFLSFLQALSQYEVLQKT